MDSLDPVDAFQEHVRKKLSGDERVFSLKLSQN